MYNTKKKEPLQALIVRVKHICKRFSMFFFSFETDEEHAYGAGYWPSYQQPGRGWTKCFFLQSTFGKNRKRRGNNYIEIFTLNVTADTVPY